MTKIFSPNQRHRDLARLFPDHEPDLSAVSRRVRSIVSYRKYSGISKDHANQLAGEALAYDGLESICGNNDDMVLNPLKEGTKSNDRVLYSTREGTWEVCGQNGSLCEVDAIMMVGGVLTIVEFSLSRHGNNARKCIKEKRTKLVKHIFSEFSPEQEVAFMCVFLPNIICGEGSELSFGEQGGLVVPFFYNSQQYAQAMRSLAESPEYLADIYHRELRS